MSGARDSSRAAISRRVIEARRKGTKVDVEYDEVPAFLDGVLETCRATTEAGAEKIRTLAKKIDEMATTDTRRPA